MAIMVGYSPSGQGTAALEAGARYMELYQDHLVIASHLYHDPLRGPSVADVGEVFEAAVQAGADRGRLSVRASEEPDVGEYLLGVAEDIEARLLIIGLRRKSKIGKLNLGAAARRVVLGAPCPVLAVKDSSVQAMTRHL